MLFHGRPLTDFRVICKWTGAPPSWFVTEQVFIFNSGLAKSGQRNRARNNRQSAGAQLLAVLADMSELRARPGILTGLQEGTILPKPIEYRIQDYNQHALTQVSQPLKVEMNNGYAYVFHGSQ